MPCGLTKDGRLIPRSEFVIPHIDGDSGEGFRGLKSGKVYREAGMTYIGREITAEEILEKLPQPPESKNTRSVLNSFIGALGDFKIGNVIGIVYEADGTFSLNLLRPSARVAERKNLP